MPEISIQRHLSATHILLPASRKALTRDQLRSALEDRLRDLLARVCLWDEDAPVGDHRFCILSYAPAKDVGVYIQFWSEPDDVVLWEVSSGNWHEPTKAYMKGERSARVKAAGFRIGGQARNFRREVAVDDDFGIQTLASAAIDLLYDALGYRGRQALEVQAVADTRAPRLPVYAAIEPDDMAAILERAGYACDVGDRRRGMTPVLVERGGLRATLLLMSRVRGEDAYEAAVIGLAPAGSPAADAPFLDGTEVTPLHFFGGVTADWIVLQVGDWFRTARAEAGQKPRRHKGRAARPKRGPSTRAREWVH